MRTTLGRAKRTGFERCNLQTFAQTVENNAGTDGHATCPNSGLFASEAPSFTAVPESGQKPFFQFAQKFKPKMNPFCGKAIFFIF